MVCLDRTYFAETENWKHCSKIIFKCVNSTAGPIFNEKVAEKWYLWVSYTVHGTHRIDKSDKKVGKVRLLFMNSSRCPLLQLTKKKKKKKKKTQHKTQTWDSLLSKRSHRERLQEREIVRQRAKTDRNGAGTRRRTLPLLLASEPHSLTLSFSTKC